MSTILKALRRLEEERTAKAERALREQVVGAAPRAARNWRRLGLRALGAAAGVAVLSLALYSWRARPPAQPASATAAPPALPHPATPPQTATAANPLASVPRPSLGGMPAPGPSQPPVPWPPTGGETGPPGASPGLPIASAGPVAASAGPPSASAGPVAASAGLPGPSAVPLGSSAGTPGPSPAEVRAAAAELAPRPDVAVVQRPPPASPEVRPEAAAANEVPQAAEEAQPGAAPPFPRRVPTESAAELPSAPEEPPTSSIPIRLREIDSSLHSPYGIHDETPKKLKNQPKEAHSHTAASTSEVLVTRTTWHPSAERRVAVVRGAGDSQEREVHEGDSIGSLQVLRIEPSDVVFLRQGVEVRQRVGTSQ